MAAKRTILLGVMVNPTEHELTGDVARAMKCTMSEAVRRLVKERAHQLGLIKTEQQTADEKGAARQ